MQNIKLEKIRIKLNNAIDEYLYIYISHTIALNEFNAILRNKETIPRVIVTKNKITPVTHIHKLIKTENYLINNNIILNIAINSSTRILEFLSKDLSIYDDIVDIIILNKNINERYTVKLSDFVALSTMGEDCIIQYDDKWYKISNYNENVLIKFNESSITIKI